MPILTATEGIVITPGLYLLELTNCELVDGTNYRTQQPEKQLKWTWRIERVMEIDPSPEQQEHVGVSYPEWSSIVCSPNSKARARAEALMSRPMTLNEEIDTDLLLGRRLKATFESYLRANGNPGSKIGPVAPYQPGVQVINQRPASAAQPGLVATLNGPVRPPAPTFAPPASTDTRPPAELIQRLTAAYWIAVNSGQRTPEDVAQLVRDLTGKRSFEEQTADQAQMLLDVLEGRQETHFTPEGAYALGLPS